MPFWFFRHGYLPSSDFPRFIHYISGDGRPGGVNSFGRERTIENVTKQIPSETTLRQIVSTLNEAFAKLAPSIGDEFRQFFIATKRVMAPLEQTSLTLKTVLAQTPFNEASARGVLEDSLLIRFSFFPPFRDKLLSAHTPNEFERLSQPLTMLVVLIYLAFFELCFDNSGGTPKFALYRPRLESDGTMLRPMARFFETALGAWIGSNFYKSHLKNAFEEDVWEAYRKQISRWRKGSLPKNFYEFDEFVRAFDEKLAQHDPSHPAHNGAKIEYGGHIIAAYYVIRILDKIATDCTSRYDVAIFGSFDNLFALYFEIFDHISECALP